MTSLVEGFESPFGLELLATVHWVMKHESVDSVPEVVDRVHLSRHEYRKDKRPATGVPDTDQSDVQWCESVVGALPRWVL